MAKRRIERVNQLLREELAKLILRSAKDPRLASVSIMAVRTTPDLKYATVYVRAGGNREALAAALEGLGSAEGFLRRELGRRLHLRRIPELTFEEDQTIERAGRIEELLRQVRSASTRPGSSPDDATEREVE
ncbi:MAG: 30S ribosome-binding factor RbfA [Gemmatimonadota bacterium]|jgi:ribosome-binding factor A|nr:MAG: 30S ribosome-binding factor RbfA [Gemmatimonadota bacterium]